MKQTGRIYVIALSGLLMMSYQNCSGYRAVQDATGTSALSSTTPNGGSGGAGVIPTTGTTVPVIMAVGAVGRTLMSCDGGATWIHDRSDDDSARCFSVTGGVMYDCDHSATAGHSIDYDDGTIYANFGWGYPGTLRSSTDGVNWTTLLTGPQGSGTLVIDHHMTVFWNYWYTSVDNGQTLSPLNPNTSPAGVLFLPYVYKFGTKMLVGGGEADGVTISDDKGVTWTTNTNVPNSSTMGGFAAGNGLIVGVGYSFRENPATAYATRSSDGGYTWSTVSIGQGFAFGPIVFDGAKFIAYGGNSTAYTSTDAITWTPRTETVDDPSFQTAWLQGTFFYDSVSQNYILIHKVWGQFYEGQHAFTSRDGINWHMLASSKFHGGHPINSMVAARVDSSVCR